jgi:predicted Zn-dependent protease
LRRNRPEQALVRLDELLERAPDDVESRVLRGRAYLALDQPAAALEDLKRATEQDPGRSDALCDLAAALEKTKQTHEALQAAERALAIDPNLTAAREIAARLRR